MQKDKLKKAAVTEDSENKTLTLKIVELVKEKAQLFHDPDDIPYATIQHDNHKETWPINSLQFRKWLGRSFYLKHNTVLSKNSLSDAINTLSGIAEYDGKKIDVYFRTAAISRNYFLDPCDDNWQVIKIVPGYYEIIEQSEEIKFRRTSAMRALPQPEKCSYKELPDLLRKHLNLEKHDIRLVLAFMVETLRPNTAYPILEISGSPGSGKSSTQERLRSCIDPNKVNLRAEPKTVEDIFVGASNNHIVSYNNLSRINKAQSDAFCSLSTGGGYAGRTLYTNLDETICDIQRPVILNGISSLAKMPDLIDRLIRITLSPISSAKVKTDSELRESFERDWPKIMGSLLDAFSRVLEKLTEVKLSKLPRMADFAKLCEALTIIYRWERSLLDIYLENRNKSFENALESSPAVTAVIKYIKENEMFDGTLKRLYENLARYKEEADSWPRSPRGLSQLLRQHSPALKSLGISIVHDRQRQKDGYHVRIKSLEKRRSPSTQSSPSDEHGELDEHVFQQKNIFDNVQGEL